MTTIPDIAYASEHERHIGDLYLPERPDGAPLALCIHGGGWNAMDKASWAGVAAFMAGEGYAAYNINYRLLDHAPWPACGDDCLAAARFLLEGEHDALAPLDRRNGLIVIGGSAGGHLAMMTGLRLAKGQARAVVSIAGPADLLERARRRGHDTFRTFFGTEEVTDKLLIDASPVSYVKGGSPPLLCVHSTHDTLVPIDQSHMIERAYHDVGARAEVYPFAGAGELHGIWVEGSDPHRLLPEIEQRISTFLKTV